MRKTESAARRQITRIAKWVTEDEVPILMATSPVQGAFLAPLLARAKHINPRSFQALSDDAMEMAFGNPSTRLIKRWVDVLSAVKGNGRGARMSHPGAHMATKFKHMLNPSGEFVAWEATPMLEAGGMVAHQAINEVRARIHFLFERRVNYHPWIAPSWMSMAGDDAGALFGGGHWAIWPNKRFVLLADSPKKYHFNNQTRLHNERGAAAVFRDGWSIYCLGGIIVPKQFILEKGYLTAGRIDGLRNNEQRRVLIEMLGYEKYMKDTGAFKLHSDKDTLGHQRILWRLNGMQGLLTNVLEVFNSTPEPDGTHKKYFLTVPHGIWNCTQAMQWMHDASLRMELDFRLET